MHIQCKLRSKQINLSIFTLVKAASNARFFIMHLHDDEKYVLCRSDYSTTLHFKLKINVTVNAVHAEPTKGRDGVTDSYKKKLVSNN